MNLHYASESIDLPITS